MKERARTALMYQEWHSLLFLHWKFEPELVQSRLPSGLTVDTFAGDAYIGIVPFYMHALRPRFAPPVPGISFFPELNLRTYVRDKTGRKGVWFFSLDAHSRISVAIAQKFFGLPYHYGKMSYSRNPDASIDFSSQRAGTPTQEFQYRPTNSLGPADSGTLSHFLVERYRLFTKRGQSLYYGELSHEPYRLHDVNVSEYSKDLFSMNGFEQPDSQPDHMVFSPRVSVEVYALRNLG